MSKVERGHGRSARPDWEPMDDSETDTGSSVQCQSCEGKWTKQFARVFGDNDNEIQQCPKCATYREMRTGAFYRGASE